MNILCRVQQVVCTSLCKHSSLLPSPFYSPASSFTHTYHPRWTSLCTKWSRRTPLFRNYASESHGFKKEKESDIFHVLNLAKKQLNYKATTERLKLLEEKIAEDGFWDDSQLASSMLREKATIEHKLYSYDSIRNEFDAYLELIEMASAENDSKMMQEALSILDSVHARVSDLEIAAVMSGPADAGACYLEIHAGAGGLEAMDWTNMILTMYTKWAARKRISLEILSINNGEVGVKSVVCKLSGEYAYQRDNDQWTEHGIHRLIRVSPFDSNGKRHTSFTSVSVTPIIDDSVNVSIDSKDLKIETMRASGAGGQHVNKTESAIRITHIPTGISVHCSNQRSQHQNRAEAMTILKGRLFRQQAEKHAQNVRDAYDSSAENGWGSQIRTYTLHPGSRVKDQRTNYETTDVDSILEGTDELDVFMRRALQWQASQGLTSEG